MTPILLALVFIGLILIVVIAGQSNEFVVSRQITVAAPPELVFPHINQLRNWEAWNPWGSIDPNCKMAYDGPAAGVGASYSWSGNNKIGAGRNSVIESRLNELVRFQLEFQKPMAATNIAEFTFQPCGEKTLVTWTMSGSGTFPANCSG